MGQKISVVGRGTVGCLSAAHFLRHSNLEIDWVYDPNVPTAAVGEGTSLIFPKELISLFNWQHTDLIKIKGTVKQGIYKENWGNGGEFLHPFPIDSVGMHLSAYDFQDAVFDLISSNPRINLIEKSVDNDQQLDSDYVMFCTGSKKELDNNFLIKNSIPVNSAYVTHCFWDYPRFTYTLTIARPWGWVFGVPLQHRCAIGYLFNKDITDLEIIKEDVKEVFSAYNLTPSDKTNHINFNNYCRVDNFNNRTVYNGNASFFLEPLEATSTGLAAYVNRYAFDVWGGNISSKEANDWYHKEISDIESMICLHYLAGSKFKTEFWDYAHDLANEKIEFEFKNKSEFSIFAAASLNNNSLLFPSGNNIGSWPELSYNINIKKLNLEDKIKLLENKYLS